LVVQADCYNSSRLGTVLALVVTSNTALAAMPDNAFLPAPVTGLPRDSVANVTAIMTLNKTDLDEFVDVLSADLMSEVDRGLRRVLSLWRSPGALPAR
jgi:mRNA interferase MazF